MVVLKKQHLPNVISETCTHRPTSSDRRAFLAQDDNLGAHGFARLLDGEAALFINVDD